ncbi:MAG: cyclic peptide export ABC transporter [Reichenbachiella sp.]|uniref:cyclic peptide export ABC transporter n=1 Tax=Reichenbachiella sp. TaxID=2184521 RepID=UPI003298324D
MKIIKLLLQSSKMHFTIASISSVLTGFCSTMVIKQVHQAISTDAFNQSEFIVMFVVFWVGYGVLAVVSTYSVSLLTQSIIHKLRVDISERILRSNFSSIERNQSKLLPVLTEDIKTIANSIDRMPSVTTGLATVIGILGYMVWFSPILTLSTILLFSVVLIITKFSLPYVRKYAEHARVLWDDVYEHFEGLIFGIKELTLNKGYKKIYVNELIVPTSKKQNSYNVKENLATSIASKSTDLVLLLGFGVLILLIYNTGFVSPEMFGQYLILVMMTIAPLSSATGFMANLKRIEVALDKINEVGLALDVPIDKKELTLNDKAKSGDELITLEGVKHEYYNPDEDEHFELGPINLSIKKGELIFLLGGNGSGKTTLAKIILGLYPAKEGNIKYEGQTINIDYVDNYRDKFAATFVDSFLFDKLVHIEDTKLEKYGQGLIETLELSKKVKIKNKKFSSKSLSEGQKKRLGLMVSILEDKGIYMFDEWAANQDPHFKEIFYKIILQDLKKAGKTIIVISHDEQYFDHGDRVIKLMEGKLV